jgi:hypothetical protein
MAIITVMLLALAIAIPAALIEGIMALHRRAKEAREWRYIKKTYY